MEGKKTLRRMSETANRDVTQRAYPNGHQTSIIIATHMLPVSGTFKVRGKVSETL